MATAPSGQVSALLKVQLPPVWVGLNTSRWSGRCGNGSRGKTRGAREYRQRGCQEAVVRMGLVSAPPSRPTQAGLFVRLGRGDE